MKPLFGITVSLSFFVKHSGGLTSTVRFRPLRSHGSSALHSQKVAKSGEFKPSLICPVHGQSRRDALNRLLGSAAITTVPIPAVAAPPMSTGEADNVGARFERSIRPKPPKVLRSKLNQDFAVLLMRSSYNALDQLDCVPMDQFQRDFFLIRQAEYEPYVNILGPGVVQQGNLVDPYYFDFISFAQYATISRDMKDPPEFFEEKQPEDMGEDEPMNFKPVIVRREVDAKLLPEKHSEEVGTAVLDRLNEIFAGTTSSIPELGYRPDSSTTLAALKQLTVLFVINGFAWEGKVDIISKRDAASQSGSAAGTQFQVVLQSPANLWSGRALQLRKSIATNDFFFKTVRVLLSRAGYGIASSDIKYESNQEITTFAIN
uniref:Uncharacterized protein n=1 Tax=Odontella aurita TaxID=265563 RepID=A0A7S4ND68_9STRA|mmetsp:Transcript_59010/g.175457  ORF Transcript_59010/g.175457 Transcript_59010/m.175457 type:complete len:374 (+) Transcript_59010:198-1319(+)|eukprot:CAMPEP_0113534532 /NCGR_PEP_ID=MMETSP0015_2-20120614/5208_1 /TAXON_ID=2838 /ORGANISM="Odontella" /LENGTH=373 /DNA_ID=CAMNT_0000433697 /DNA_START=104 /DNA_END=1225 /DNA_ORIENTATION=+ /assembly_acc=CAM_ASM_000160